MVKRDTVYFVAHWLCITLVPAVTAVLAYAAMPPELDLAWSVIIALIAAFLTMTLALLLLVFLGPQLEVRSPRPPHGPRKDLPD